LAPLTFFSASQTEDLKKRKEFEEAEERRRKLREAEARLVEKGKQPYFVTKCEWIRLARERCTMRCVALTVLGLPLQRKRKSSR
jgi:hypothetical protein